MKKPSLILETLKLQNFATFKTHEVHFSVGLNAIIGETGSGKSLLLDALQLVFGGRADKKAVRHGCDSTVVEAVMKFSDNEITRTLDDMGFPCEEGEVIIKRMVRKDGTSKCWLNNMTCSLGQLVTFSRRYIDLVGQFENQKLLSDGYQLRLLDQFGQTTKEAKEMKEQLEIYRALREERDQLERSKSEREQRLDYLDFQINEIDSLGPVDGEEEQLIALKNDFLNHEKKQLLHHQLSELIEGGEQNGGLSSLLRTGRSLFAKNSAMIPAHFSEKFSVLESSYEELAASFRGLSTKELDAEELQQAIDRLDLYQKLKRKFGGTVLAIIETRAQFDAEASRLREIETDLSSLFKKLHLAEQTVHRLADKLHEKRAEKAVAFSKELTRCVQELKMTGAEIRLEVERSSELTDAGYTRLSFLAQTNPGEGFFRVKEIASGGELSRILLALRQILATHDSISIFLFDEIDTGMGGETALHIGRSLKKVSLNSQVVTITHLPQISSFADKLIVVSKTTTADQGEDRTESRVKELVAAKDIRKEIERMTPIN
ncbi:MAG: DNA repair protein RecN [Bacteriovoracia bacterium]